LRVSQRVGKLKEGIDKKKRNEIDYIYHEVKDQANRIVVKRERPEEATIDIYGVRIKKTIVHSKSEEYNGADLYLEVEDQKFALVQFKVQHSRRFDFDRKQLQKLGVWCPYCTKDASRPILCPSFVWLISTYDDTEKHRIVKLCQLGKILGDRSSASFSEFIYTGITRNTFKELLAKCWVGAPFKRKPSTEELLDYSKTLNRLLVTFNMNLIDQRPSTR
jgi:hypothetical protein